MTVTGRRLRRLADAQGLTLRKVPKRNRWHGQHDLFLVVDATSRRIVASGISDVEGVAATLAETEPGRTTLRCEDLKGLSQRDRIDH
jgi:hypothetical protein